MHSNQQTKYEDLAEKWLKGTISPTEAKEYADWYNQHSEVPLAISPTVASSEKMLEELMLNHITAVRNAKNVTSPIHRIHLLRTAWFRYAAAILLITCACAYLYFSAFTNNKNLDAAEKQADISAPSLIRATLTLANGRIVVLDTVSRGILAAETDANIEKLVSGDIIYHPGELTGEMQYNVLSVPKGSQIANVILSDGSKVFLNAASSIRYPVVFGKKERKVEITGEAYFEVSKDASRKFVVESSGTTTEVLGTHFNVNAYPNEEGQKITLVEGSVRVRNNNESIIIKPGEQVLRLVDEKLKINYRANVGQVIAWRKGIFVFTDMSLPSILRQVERWYNISVKYEGKIPSVSYGGGLSRNLPLSEVIKLLQSDKVDIKLEGAVLTVKSK